MSRDEFSAATKRLLASPVGMRCSNPSGLSPTDRRKTRQARNLGQAAHITAASSGGLRFDSGLTNVERVAPENGIWLCSLCGKLVDSDESGHSVELLREWKEAAEFLGHTALIAAPQRALRSEEILRQLKQFLPAEVAATITHSVTGGSVGHHMNPSQDRIHRTEMPEGIVLNYMVRDGRLMTEIDYPGDLHLVADLTPEGAVWHKFSYPMHET